MRLRLGIRGRTWHRLAHSPSPSRRSVAIPRDPVAPRRPATGAISRTPRRLAPCNRRTPVIRRRRSQAKGALTHPQPGQQGLNSLVLTHGSGARSWRIPRGPCSQTWDTGGDEGSRLASIPGQNNWLRFLRLGVGYRGVNRNAEWCGPSRQGIGVGVRTATPPASMRAGWWAAHVSAQVIRLGRGAEVPGGVGRSAIQQRVSGWRARRRL